MAKITAITTGEQSVSAAGAITGSLATATLTGDYTVKLRVRGLTAAQSVQIALEDTANASAYSEATQPVVFSFLGVAVSEGATKSVRAYEIPNCRFGTTNTALRFNCQSLIGSPTALVEGWLEQ